MCSVLNVLVAVVLLTHVSAELKDGPQNVVGYFTEHVTLHCNRDALGGVTWWYIAPGSEREQTVPGRHSYSGSSYGHHNLRLENLQRSDAGMYVCRSSHVPQSFGPASAFLVVVANHPQCRANYTELVDQHKYTVSCRITYNGLLNLTLSLINSDDNYTIASHNYTSLIGGSWWHLEREIPVNLKHQQLKTHVCIAKFYSSKTGADIAKNSPTDIEVPCEPLPPGYVETFGSGSERPRAQTTITVTPGIFNQTKVDGILPNTDSFLVSTGVINNTTSETTAHSKSRVAVIVLLLVFIFVVILFVACLTYDMQNRERCNGGGHPDPDNLISIAVHEDNADKATSKLLANGASKLQRNSSRANLNCSAQDLSVQYHVGTANDQCGGPSGVQPSNSVSVSASESSLHSNDSHSLHDHHADEDEDESNEKTVISNTRTKLAEAAVAARVGLLDRK